MTESLARCLVAEATSFYLLGHGQNPSPPSNHAHPTTHANSLPHVVHAKISAFFLGSARLGGGLGVPIWSAKMQEAKMMMAAELA